MDLGLTPATILQLILPVSLLVGTRAVAVLEQSRAQGNGFGRSNDS